MKTAFRHIALAQLAVLCPAAFGADGETGQAPPPMFDHRLIPSLIAEWIPDAGDRFPEQFGLAILDGVAALRPGLDEWEEPPPNPQWPGPMEENSIYFGGTDCGRFIPESIILNDGVRPDVLLITQNALVDRHYTDVLRRRLGGKCWIPRDEDQASAFETYVQEVRTGRRPNNPGLCIAKDGSILVTGIQGVMEVNGIIAKFIFERNKDDHDVYVEESYAIPWMTDYMSPHGLVLKLNAEKTDKLADADLMEDLDFWDWQTRRLLDDPQFCHRRSERWRNNPEGDKDTDHRVACRTFSKLRCAIAALYAAKGNAPQARKAFRDAHAIDPQSPEVIARYVQDCLLKEGSLDAAIDLLEHYVRVAPDDLITRTFLEKMKQLRR